MSIWNTRCAPTAACITGKEKILQTEKLVLRTIKDNPASMVLYKRQKQWNLLIPVIKSVRQDIYEMRLLKYFDFSSWAEKEYT